MRSVHAIAASSVVLAVLLLPIGGDALRLSVSPRAPTPMMAAAKKKGSKKKKAASGGGGGFGAQKPAAAAAPPRAETATEREWRGFEAWLRDSGARCDAVSLADCGSGLRGTKAQRSLKRGDEVLRIPRDIILDETRAGPVAVLFGDDEIESGGAPLPAYARLALMILHEQRLGEASRVAPYIAMLPSPADFAAEGGPAVMWTDEELEATECAKLVGDAKRRRGVLDHPALEPSTLSARWREAALPGEPPTASELSWAVAAVTSRAYGAEEGGVRLSLLIPMVDMANHAHVPRTVKGLEEEGEAFVVLAAEPIKAGQEVHLSYGNVPNLLLLMQFGFVLADHPPDIGLVNCEAAFEGGDGSVLSELAEEGRLMRDADGSASAWQPAGPALQAALQALAEADALPAALVAAADLPAAAEAEAEAVGLASYRQLLQATLDGYSTSVAEDRDALGEEGGGLSVRRRLAVSFRLEQKKILNRELAVTFKATRQKTAGL